MARAFKIVCVSIYTDELRALDAQVARLKELGIKKVTRSSLIRYAVRLLPTGNRDLPDTL